MAGRKFRLAVEPSRNPLLAEEAFDQKQSLDWERAGAEGLGEGELTLVGDLLHVHPAGFGMVDGKREAAFPVVHAVVGAMLLLGVGHGLGKSPNLPAKILSHAGGMETHMMLSDSGDHGFGANYW